MAERKKRLTADAARALLDADAQRLAKKVKAGEPLSKADRDFLTATAAEEDRAAAGFWPTLAAIAGFFEVTAMTVKNWKAEKPEAFRKIKGSGYPREPIVEFVQSRFGREGDDTSDSGQSKLELQKAILRQQLLKIARENAEADGSLQDKAQTRSELGLIFSSIRQNLDGIGSSLGPIVITVDKATEARRMIDDAISDALSGFVELIKRFDDEPGKKKK